MPVRQNDKGRRHRTDRAAEAAAELEQRLRHAMRAARGEPRQPGRFRMEDRCAQPEQGRSGKQREVIQCVREQANAEERAPHAISQRIRLRLAIGVETDQRLQQRSDALKDQRDYSDLTEIQIERALEHRIDRRQERHGQIVQQMAEADRRQDDKCSAAGLLPARDGLSHGRNLSSLRANKLGAGIIWIRCALPIARGRPRLPRSGHLTHAGLARRLNIVVRRMQLRANEHYVLTLFTGVSGVRPPRRCANVSLPVSSHWPATARLA